MSKVFANDPGDLGSIPGRVIPKTLKMELDTSLLNTQEYRVHIKGKLEQSRERGSALPYTSLEKLSNTVADFILHTNNFNKHLLIQIIYSYMASSITNKHE